MGNTIIGKGSIRIPDYDDKFWNEPININWKILAALNNNNHLDFAIKSGLVMSDGSSNSLAISSGSICVSGVAIQVAGTNKTIPSGEKHFVSVDSVGSISTSTIFPTGSLFIFGFVENIAGVLLISDIGQQLKTNFASKPMFHAQDQRAPGTQGGSNIVGTQTRVLNTILTNEIPGASLSSNQITLPAGEYYVEGSAPAFCTSYNKTRLYNITTSAYILEGQSSVASSTYTSMSNSIIAGKISSATQFTLELRHYTSIVKTTEGLGTAANQGTEVYADFKVWALNQERAIPLVSNTTGNNPGIIQGGDISSSGNTLSITPTSCLDSSALIPLVITSGKTLVIPSTNNQDFFVFIVKLVSDGSMVYKAYTTFEAPTSDILINAYRFISYCKTNGSGVVIPFLQNGCEWTTLSRLDILVASSLGTSYTAYNINAIVPVVICERMKLWFEGLTSNGQGHISYDGVNITYIGGYIGGKHDVLAVNTLYMKYYNVNFGIYITDLKLRR